MHIRTWYTPWYTTRYSYTRTRRKTEANNFFIRIDFLLFTDVVLPPTCCFHINSSLQSSPWSQGSTSNSRPRRRASDARCANVPSLAQADKVQAQPVFMPGTSCISCDDATRRIFKVQRATKYVHIKPGTTRVVSPSSERVAVVHASSVISRNPAYRETAPKSLSCNGVIALWSC